MSSKIPDPEVGMREAVGLLKLSEGRIRELADSGDLPCTRDLNNQRRFKFSDLMRHQQRRERRAEQLAQQRRKLVDARQRGRS
jgi:hypothetical protein